MPTFQATVAVLGGLLILGALVSGIAQRSMLSLAALFVLAGFLVGNGGFGWVDLRAQSGFVEDLAFVALIVILFRDGLEVEEEMLRRAWHLPLRKLVLAMPVTAVLIAAGAKLLIGLSWTEALLLGALLSPTDPVLSSSVVTNPKVPRVIRHSLNLESGLNDGLALPAVLAFSAALSSSSSGFVWWRFVLQDVGLGLLFGLACGWAASLLMPNEERNAHAGAGARALRPVSKHTTPAPTADLTDNPTTEPKPSRRWTIPAQQTSLFALGVAFGTFGITVLSPKGNGFIAVFVAAIVLGIRRPELRARFEEHAQVLVELVKLGIFLVFGSLLTVNALTTNGWEALALVFVTFVLARPIAVWLALMGTDTDGPTRLFMGWFGPKGIASMTFGLLVLDAHIAAGQQIFDLVALTVLCSIVVHGSSDTIGANWIARHAGRKQLDEPQLDEPLLSGPPQA